MLIAFEKDGATAVMHYLGADTSDDAISAHIAKAHCINAKWRRITKEEYKAIRDARPKPQAPVKAPETQEPATSGIMVQPPPAVLAPDDTAGRLALAVSLANYAIAAGCEAGDYRWHGGDKDFEWGGQRYDAPGLIEYAKGVLG